MRRRPPIEDLALALICLLTLVHLLVVLLVLVERP